MNLDELQLRLKDHFSALCQQRALLADSNPLYALEHGLSVDERESLAVQVREEVSDGWPEDTHWLPWIVYAAELGYNYDGEEYWQSFEKRTPGWSVRGDREWIRSRFWRFQKEFFGAIPTGRWARHFSIICWPITHAILPLDLQRQLAQNLYELRYSLRPDLLQSPELLGQQIAIGSWKFSSRFRILAQQPVLLGQIATALLLKEEPSLRSLILSSCLLRIAEDLDGERRAREWLRDAQGVARASLSGVVRTEARVQEEVAPSAAEELRALGIEPSLYLRPTSDSWEVVLEIPDLAPLLARFPLLRGSLDESLCWVAGSNGRPLARGRLFRYGPQSVVLRKWPSPAEILLRFENSCPEIEYLLSAECMLRPGAAWLCKISSDGFAYEIRGKTVRPGSSYILLRADGEVPQGVGVSSIHVECEGIAAFLIRMPSGLDESGLQQLTDIGLNPANRLQITPVGIPPAKWDGEGHVEWLSTDRPCISLGGDRSFNGILLNLEGPVPQKLELAVDGSGESMFFELGDLSPGDHRLHVLVQLSSDRDDLLSGALDITIRPPRVWTEGLTDQNPFLPVIDPPNPSLEKLWSNTVALELRGPTMREVSIDLLFFATRVSAQPALRRTLPKISLPFATSDWHSYFERLQQDKTLQDAFDEAVRAEILFSAEELGEFRLVCERESSPLLWSVRWENHSYVLSLYDDTGEACLHVNQYEFNSPDVPRGLDPTIFVNAGLRVPDSGGLYTASTTGSSSAIVVPPLLKQLGDLKANPRLAIRGSSVETFRQLLALRQLWLEARITGDPISADRRRSVLECINMESLRSLYGADWTKLEVTKKPLSDRIAEFKTLIWDQPPGTSLGAAVLAKREEIAAKSTRDRVKEFSRLVNNYLVLPAFQPKESKPECPSDWIAEFSLRLATAPDNALSWSGVLFPDAMQYVFRWPQLARSARMLTLAVASPDGTQNAPIIDPTQWGWQ